MTPQQVALALALFDLLLTGLEKIGQQIAQAKKEGLITVEEQQARRDRVDAIRKEVGL
jgi:hypothetical protein